MKRVLLWTAVRHAMVSGQPQRFGENMQARVSGQETPVPTVSRTRRRQCAVSIGMLSITLLTACTGPTASEPAKPESTHISGGITRDEAAQRGVDAAPGDGRITSVEAVAGSKELRVTVINVSDTDDEYTIVISSGSARLGHLTQTVRAGQDSEFVLLLDAPIPSGPSLEVRLDGGLLGEGVALVEISPR